MTTTNPIITNQEAVEAIHDIYTSFCNLEQRLVNAVFENAIPYNTTPSEDQLFELQMLVINLREVRVARSAMSNSTAVIRYRRAQSE